MKRAIALKNNFVAVWKLKKIECEEKVSVYFCKGYTSIAKTLPLDHHVFIAQFGQHQTRTTQKVLIHHFLL